MMEFYLPSEMVFHFSVFCCWEENKINVDDWRLMKD